jgi:hypothetical protein
VKGAEIRRKAAAEAVLKLLGGALQRASRERPQKSVAKLDRLLQGFHARRSFFSAG